LLPRIILHNVVSLDGRIDWFTPDVGLYYELISRWREDATLVGSDTIIAQEGPTPEEDDDGLPDGESAEVRPLLVVPDSRGRVRSWRFLRKQPYWRGVVALCSHTTPASYLAYLRRERVEVMVSGQDHVDLRSALERLNEKQGVKIVRVDSGGTLNGVLLRQGLVDEISLLIHPSLVGGTSPRSLFRATDLASPESVIPLRLDHVEQLRGGVVWLRYAVVK
jgi:2,5-diamino-6-(ribosylamino)-4(3H)-pyrimidinone 5'-phosphate reductase